MKPPHGPPPATGETMRVSARRWSCSRRAVLYRMGAAAGLIGLCERRAAALT
jgi:hypothetical protein